MADNATVNNNLNLLIRLTQKMLSNKKVVSSKNTETSKVIDTSMFLSSSVVFQNDLSKQFKILKSDIKKLTNINKELLKSVNVFTKDKKKLKFNKIDDPLDFFKRKRSGSDSGGLLGSLFGFGKNSLTSIIKLIIRKQLGKSAINSVIRNVGSNVSRIGASAGARFLGSAALEGAGGAIAGTATTIGMPALIAAAAAAVGYGSYKIGRYLKLSEKLDSFISKVSGGKYDGIVDFVIGIGKGEVGKDLWDWVSKKSTELFNDGTKYLKEKIDEILKKLNLFGSSDLSDKDSTDPTKQKDLKRKTEANKAQGTEPINGSSMSPENSGAAPQNGTGSGSLWQKTKDAVSNVASTVSNTVSSAYNSVKDTLGLGSSDSNTGPNIGTGKISARPVANSFRITSPFGMRVHPVTGKKRMHKGVDFGTPVGTSVTSAGDGKVVKAGTGTGYGNVVYVDHGNGVTTRYAHLSSFTVKPGDNVKAGQEIAKSGNSGLGTGPHLHFEVRQNDEAKDPLSFIGGSSVVSAGPKGGPADISYGNEGSGDELPEEQTQKVKNKTAVLPQIKNVSSLTSTLDNIKSNSIEPVIKNNIVKSIPDDATVNAIKPNPVFEQTTVNNSEAKLSEVIPQQTKSVSRNIMNSTNNHSSGNNSSQSVMQSPASVRSPRIMTSTIQNALLSPTYL